MRKIFGPKKEKVAGDWRKLYNEENNNNLYSLPYVINAHGRD
jgi:hypothetical protein